MIKITLFALFISIISTAHADPFRDGVVAYQHKQFKQAIDTWRPLAESGHVLAQTLIGSMYAYGEGVEKDDSKAFKWLSLAASSGSSQAQYNLGVLYEKGFGVVADTEQARVWFKAAADQGRKDAATRLALLEDDSATVAESRDATDNTLAAETIAPKQRIHIVLNGRDSELLGPPDTQISHSLSKADYGLDWVNKQPPAHYTIQLAASIEPRLIEAFKKSIKLTTQYADTTSTHNGRQWHALIYGSYETVHKANQAISQFPDSWKLWQPWIKTFSSVKHIKP